MCSENSVNSQPTCTNHWAMTTVARESWGFDGCELAYCVATASDHSSYSSNLYQQFRSSTQIYAIRLLQYSQYSQWVGWGLIWSQALDSDIVPESQSI